MAAKRKPRPITARNACDRMFSQLVRARGRCQLCGTTDRSKLQCAHIISRRYSWTRTLLENAWCLCAACHWKTHREPDLFMELVKRTIGEDGYQDLKELANGQVGAKYDWFAEREVLKKLHAELAA